MHPSREASTPQTPHQSAYLEVAFSLKPELQLLFGFEHIQRSDGGGLDLLQALYPLGRKLLTPGARGGDLGNGTFNDIVLHWRLHICSLYVLIFLADVKRKCNPACIGKGDQKMAKPDALFVTDAQLAERIGLTTEQIKAKTSTLEKSGFPSKDVMFENRRYWPAVRAWLDRRYGLYGAHGHNAYPLDEEELWKRSGGRTAPPGLDGKENWKR